MIKSLKSDSGMTAKFKMSKNSKRKLNKRQRKLNKKKTQHTVTMKVKSKLKNPSKGTLTEEKSKGHHKSRSAKISSSSKKRKREESVTKKIENNSKKLKTVYEIKSPEDYSANWKQLKELLTKNKSKNTIKQVSQKEKPTPVINEHQSEEDSKDHKIWFDDVDPSLLDDEVKVNTVSTEKNASELDLETRTNESFTGLTKIIALDCEMVGGGAKGEVNILARVSLVNFHGNVIYDKYVKPREPVKDYRTKVSGIRPKDIANGESYNVVQNEVSDMLRNRILVGHDLKNDLSCLMIHHPAFRIRDTSKYEPFTKLYGRRPSLKKLAEKVLSAKIQSGEHDSVEDARTAMRLYALNRKTWEMDHVHRKKNKPKKAPQNEHSNC